ncbi:MAG: Bax inhibitor-1/YccA family protein [Vallitaleaceae bacterium]|nr:Bax inhibitor-1/YccA family protein [Vallitaleaceae bacterium]
MKERELTLSGQNAFLGRIFLWMFLGLMVTALTSLWVISSPTVLNLMFSSRFTFFGLIIAEVGLVMYFSSRVMKLSQAAATLVFLAYSFLNGLTLSVYLLVYTGESVALAFTSAAFVFAIMGIYGHFTKTDLSPFRSFLMVALIGIVISSILNIFIASSSLSYIISLIGVVVFAGLTAYDIQSMKALYVKSANSAVPTGNLVLMGALTLYLDFINLFIMLLRLVGRRR